MAIDFPSSPADGATFVSGGVTWTYVTAKTAWIVTTSSAYVSGPASAVDGTPAVFDLATGKLIKNITYAAFKTLLALVKGDVGLGNVDNTSDVGKPVSTAQATSIALKIAGPGTVTTDLPVVFSGTTGLAVAQKTYAAFKTLLALVKGDVGLGSVDNTSDAGKPVSTAQQTALNLKADLASPVFTGNPTGPTATAGDNDTSLATTAFVAAAILASAGAPSGSILMYGGSSAPTGFLLCDGSLVSRSTYAALFTAISTNYGAGDGSTTFGLPDMRGRIPVGLGTGTIAETQAAANFNVSDIITVNSNTMTAPKWQTGMPVIITTTGVLPTGIAAATTYYVIRLSATTIKLATSLALAMAYNANLQTPGTAVNITATGSGNHTITCTLPARALADMFGYDVAYTVPSHAHSSTEPTGSTGASGHNFYGTYGNTLQSKTVVNSDGDTNGVSNSPPSTVVNYIIKT